MENKKKIPGRYIVGSAIIWAAMIIGCALILKERFNDILWLLTSAATIHLIVIEGSLAAQLKNKEKSAN